MTNANKIKEHQEFQIRCDAGETRQFHCSAQRASIRVGQRILRNAAEEMWDSVVVLCQEEEGGVLAIRVVVCHPDWGEPRGIACVRSWFGTPVRRGAALECNLGYVGQD